MSPAEASTSGSTSTIQIKKLNGCECYPDWAYFMKIYLKGEALWKITAGIKKRPPDQAPSTSERSKDNMEAVEKWEVKDSRAQIRILAQVDDSLHTKWKDTETATELWNAIEKTYAEQSSQNILVWWLDLTCTILDEGEPVQPHLDKILEANQKLKAAKFEIPEPLLTIIILVSLPDSYTGLITTLQDNTSSAAGEKCDSLRTSEFVVNQLLEDEKMREIRESTGGGWGCISCYSTK
jgi:gag-polypeptide of LTR copia-type